MEIREGAVIGALEKRSPILGWPAALVGALPAIAGSVGGGRAHLRESRASPADCGPVKFRQPQAVDHSSSDARSFFLGPPYEA